MEETSEPILRFFEYEHLPLNLQKISKRFWHLSNDIVDMTPRCAERTVALRKLLESKDAAVRVALVVSG